MAPNKIFQVLKIRNILVLIYLQFLFIISGAKNDRNDWVDPGDMLRYDFASKSMKSTKNYRTKFEPTAVSKPTVTQDSSSMCEIGDEDGECSAVKSELTKLYSEEECQQRCSKKCDDCDMRYLKRFIHHLMYHLAYNPRDVHHPSDSSENSEDNEITFDAQITLKETDLRILKNYLQPNQRRPSLADIDQILTNLIYSARLRTPNDTSWSHSHASDFYSFLYTVANNEYFIIIGTAMAAVIMSFVLLHHLTLVGLILIWVIGLLALSFSMEYTYLKQVAEAEQLFQQSQFDNMPKECQPSQMSYGESFSSFIKISIFGMENKCREYYKTMVVNPRFEITPTTVLTSMAGKIGVAIAGMAGKSISTFTDNLIEGKSFFGLLLYVPIVMFFVLAVIWLTCPIIMATVPRLIYEMGRQVQRGGRPMIEDVLPNSDNTVNRRLDVSGDQNVAQSCQRHSHHSSPHCCNLPTTSKTKSKKSPNRQISVANQTKALSNLETPVEEEQEPFYDSSDHEIANISPTRPTVLIYKEMATQT